MTEATHHASIEKLDDETVATIAAGEVVTRPAAVVKELVENSLDAGASRIDVEVAGDGTERIRVRDDGRGMSEVDAELAVERHTTSKVSGPADVERVGTLGFRGEALPSIASAAELELVTNDGGARGTRVTVAGGETSVAPAGRAVGTTVEVRDLFRDRPARRKSLASPETEFSRISDLVSGYALVRPDVRFSLSHDGREVLSTAGSGAYADAALGVYDRSVASRSTTFEHETTIEVDGSERPLRVEGLLVYPSITRARRDHVYTAVNGRAIQGEALRRATVAGYGSLLPTGRAPIAVVAVDLPPAAVDVNVHPRKRTVAFVDGDAVEAAVEEGVRDALTTADLRRSAEVAMDLDSSLQPLDGDSAFDDATLLGRYRELYLLCESEGDLLVVDQHAAHERVNYERLRAALDGDPASVELDPPETVSLSPAEAAAVADAEETLARLGFELESFGGGAYRVTRVPAPLGRVVDADALRDAVDALRAGEDPRDARDDLLKDLACHPSLKAGDALSEDDAAALVRRLGECEQPFACPHGRPTVLSIDEEAFVRGFERHGTRRD
jgi:DNA mismatch repair protein MutL